MIIPLLTQISSHLVPIQRSLSTYTFPNPNLQFSKFLHCIPSKSMTIQLKYWPLLRKQCWSTSLAISPSRQNKQPGTLFSTQPTGRISFLYCPSQFIPGQGSSAPAGHFQGILRYCTEPSINWASLFFLCQLVIGNSAWDHNSTSTWDERQCSQCRGHGHLPLTHAIYSFKTYLRVIFYISPLYHDVCLYTHSS